MPNFSDEIKILYISASSIFFIALFFVIFCQWIYRSRIMSFLFQTKLWQLFFELILSLTVSLIFYFIFDGLRESYGNKYNVRFFLMGFTSFIYITFSLLKEKTLLFINSLFIFFLNIILMWSSDIKDNLFFIFYNMGHIVLAGVLLFIKLTKRQNRVIFFVVPLFIVILQAILILVFYSQNEWGVYYFAVANNLAFCYVLSFISYRFYTIYNKIEKMAEKIVYEHSFFYNWGTIQNVFYELIEKNKTQFGILIILDYALIDEEEQEKVSQIFANEFKKYKTTFFVNEQKQDCVFVFDFLPNQVDELKKVLEKINLNTKKLIYEKRRVRFFCSFYGISSNNLKSLIIQARYVYKNISNSEIFVYKNEDEKNLEQNYWKYLFDQKEIITPEMIVFKKIDIDEIDLYYPLFDQKLEKRKGLIENKEILKTALATRYKATSALIAFSNFRKTNNDIVVIKYPISFFDSPDFNIKHFIHILQDLKLNPHNIAISLDLKNNTTLNPIVVERIKTMQRKGVLFAIEEKVNINNENLIFDLSMQNY